MKHNKNGTLQHKIKIIIKVKKKICSFLYLTFSNYYIKITYALMITYILLLFAGACWIMDECTALDICQHLLHEASKFGWKETKIRRRMKIGWGKKSGLHNLQGKNVLRWCNNLLMMKKTKKSHSLMNFSSSSFN